MSHAREDSFLRVHHLAFALSKARNLLRAEVDAALAGADVSSSDFGALLLMSRGMGGSSAELSKHLDVDPGFITRVVDRLEGQGLVRRDRDTPDRRVINLTLTEAGHRIASRLAVVETEVLNRRLSDFAPDEFARLCGLLGKLIEN